MCAVHLGEAPMPTMQTAIGRSGAVRRPRRLFFPGMSLLAIAIVVAAFVPEYFGNAPLRLPVVPAVEIHAAIMTAWVLVFFVQAYLGATHRIARHRTIGNFGILLGWVALLSMMFVHIRALVLQPAPEDLEIYDRLLPFLYVYLAFSLFLYWAYRKRTQPEWHKRFITCALFISLEAAVQRLQWLPSGFGYWPFAVFLDGCLLVPLVLFDITTLERKLHPATVRGALVVLGTQGVLFCLWGTTAWRHFAYTLVHALPRP